LLIALKKKKKMGEYDLTELQARGSMLLYFEPFLLVSSTIARPDLGRNAGRLLGTLIRCRVFLCSRASTRNLARSGKMGEALEQKGPVARYNT
jgi:hypothetical protein